MKLCFPAERYHLKQCISASVIAKYFAIMFIIGQKRELMLVVLDLKRTAKLEYLKDLANFFPLVKDD